MGYASIEEDVASPLQESILYTMHIRTMRSLRTCDSMGTQPPFNTLDKLTFIHGIMHDTMASLRCIWCMAQHTEMTYNTMVSLDST